MKIKTKKKMRLDELLKHVWHEGGEHKTYMSNEGKSVDIDDSGIQFLNDYKINSGIVLSKETFTVEVEEELTKSIHLDRITIFFYDTQTRNNGFGTYRDLSIQEALEMNRGTLRFISMAVDDVLIWSRDSGIPESGVLEEVSE